MFDIKRAREAAGLSQQEVADALGIKKARYGDWERETTMVNLRDAVRVADLFGCTLDELVSRRPKPNVVSLSERELAVVRSMRETDTRGRDAIACLAECEAEAVRRLRR